MPTGTSFWLAGIRRYFHLLFVLLVLTSCDDSYEDLEKACLRGTVGATVADQHISRLAVFWIAASTFATCAIPLGIYPIGLASDPEAFSSVVHNLTASGPWYENELGLMMSMMTMMMTATTQATRTPATATAAVLFLQRPALPALLRYDCFFPQLALLLATSTNNRPDFANLMPRSYPRFAKMYWSREGPEDQH